MAAQALAEAGRKVIVADAAPSPARKFLLAGRGGLNLTHSEPLDRFLARYGPAGERLRPAIEAFPPDALRAWSAALGEPTFVGSSGRVFPRSFKSTPLLRAWLRRLEALGVVLRARHRLIGLPAEGGGALYDARRRRRSRGGRDRARARRRLLAAAGERRRLGRGSCAPPGSRSRRSSRPTPAFSSNGRRIFANVSKARL